MLAWGIAQATSWVFVEPLGVLFAPLVLTPRTACRIARNALKPPSWWPRLGLRRTKTQPVKPIVALESPVKAALEETARQARAQSPWEPAPSPAAEAGAGLALNCCAPVEQGDARAAREDAEEGGDRDVICVDEDVYVSCVLHCYVAICVCEL